MDDHTLNSAARSIQDVLKIDVREEGISSNRRNSNDFDGHHQSGSMFGANGSMLSSGTSDVDAGELDRHGGIRTLVSHVGVDDMIRDPEIRARYPLFYNFLQEHESELFENSYFHGTSHRFQGKPGENRDHKTKNDIYHEMLDLMHRFYRQKDLNRSKKREIEELKESNRQLRIASVQIYAKAEQEEEFISNSLLKKIQKLKSDKDFLMKKYQKDEESLTNDLMAIVAKIAESHQNRDDTEKLVADKQAEIERLQAQCRRAEKNYQEELFRLRAEKVNHESALEQEQELLINTLGKRMTLINEEKRKMQSSLEKAYLNGFAEYDEGVEAAFRASASNKYGVVSSPSPTFKSNGQSPMSSTSSLMQQQLTEAGSLFIENQKLTGVLKSMSIKVVEHEQREQELEKQVRSLQNQIEYLKSNRSNPDNGMAYRVAMFYSRMNNGDDVPSTSDHVPNVAAVPPTQAVAPQPVQHVAAYQHPNQQQQAQPPTLATVLPIQRSSSSRNDSSNM